MRPPKFINPWAVDPPTKAEGDVVDAPRPPPAYDDPSSLPGRPPVADVRVPGYGGLRVVEATTATEAVLKVMDFFFKHRATVDPVLVEYGVLFAQLSAVPAQGFYVQRGWDKWTLSVPEAQTRDQAILQIIQALLELERGPLRAAMHQEGVQPYRM